jgi:hypothetical protein
MQEAGKWLGQFKWTLYATFTFRRGVRAGSAIKSVQGFIISHDPSAKFVLVVRHYQGEGNPHIHSLIRGLEGFDRLYLVNRWYNSHGIARILPYDKNRGASYYLAKNALGDWGELDVSGM